MKIVKFCKKNHNITDGSDIQIGTSVYYRKKERSTGTRDEEETIYNIGISRSDGEFTELNSNQLNKISSGAKFDGQGRIFAKKVIVEGLNINVFLFCAKKTDNPKIEEGQDFDGGYDSFYVINDLEKFSSEIAKMIVSKLNKKYEDIKVLSLRGDVFYSDNKGDWSKSIDEHLGKKIDPNTWDLLLKTVFTKSNELKDNNEYRFAWLVFDGDDKLLNLENDFIHLESDVLKEFCSLG